MGYRILGRYLTREYFLNFLVSFIFFFTMFFINSILLLVQRILLKNISFSVMLEMVLLNMPQFMIYVFPFAVLSSSSMVLGNLGSSNELLALRSSGIPMRHVYRPLIVFSIFFAIVTFLFSDAVLPWSSARYSKKLSELMRDMPTFEIEPNSVNTVGNVVLSNGDANGNTIEDIILISTQNDQDRTIISEKGILNLIDPYNYVYSLELENPKILLTDKNDVDSTGLSESESAIFYLDFSSQIPNLTSSSPVKLSSRDLIQSIESRKENIERSVLQWHREREDIKLNYAKELKRGISFAALTDAYKDASTKIGRKGKSEPVSYNTEYYRSELAKKVALSLACVCLTLIALPLSLVRVRHGRLTGFAISVLIAVLYWYMLFGAQLEISSFPFSTYLLIMIPDLIILSSAFVLMYAFRRSR